MKRLVRPVPSVLSNDAEGFSPAVAAAAVAAVAAAAATAADEAGFEPLDHEVAPVQVHRRRKDSLL
jgi:hypothetical protein